MSYELRYSYSPDLTLGEADVRSRHESIEGAAVAFAVCSAPFKQILYVCEHDEPHFLDQEDEAVVQRVAAEHGLEVVEVDGDA